MEKLRIDGFPNYLLIDKNGNMGIMNGTIEELKKESTKSSRQHRRQPTNNQLIEIGEIRLESF